MNKNPVTFIGVDGEGVTDETDSIVLPNGERVGKHEYVLLASSEGNYIENYQHGLDTESCLDFLLQQAHKQTVVVGFYFSYDVNMMLRDIDGYTLAKIWAGHLWTWRAPSGRLYRFKMIPNRLLEISRGYWNETTWKQEKRVQVWDTSAFFQTSFVKSLARWDVAEQAIIDRIADMKNQRGIFTVKQVEQIREYCIDECRLLVRMMEKVQDALLSVDIHLSSWYGAGAIANALLRDKHANNVMTDDDAINELGKLAYYGGRIETFAIGIHDATSWEYDIRSAYPNEIAQLPDTSNAALIIYDAWQDDNPHSMWHIRWCVEPGKHAWLAPFPFRKDKRIYWPTMGEGWYHYKEIVQGIKTCQAQGIWYDILEGIGLQCQNSSLPFSWFEQLYEWRAQLKADGNPAENVLKLGYNAGYGKFAQSQAHGRKPRYQNYWLAGAVTAGCRARVAEMALKAGQDSVLAIATDAVIVRDRIPDIDIGTRLGQWDEIEIEPGLLLVQPGVYMTPSRSIVHTRGFAAASMIYDEFATTWTEQGIGSYVSIPETRFIGLGYALSTGHVDDWWRRWIPGEKRITLSGTASKFPRMPIGERLQYLSCAPGWEDESEIYVARERGIDYTTDWEQPDMPEHEWLV